MFSPDLRNISAGIAKSRNRGSDPEMYSQVGTDHIKPLQSSQTIPDLMH